MEEVDSTYPTKGTQTFGKKTIAIEEPSEEGEASMPNKVSKNATHLQYCRKIGHREEECRKTRSESASMRLRLTIYATNSEYDDYDGLIVMRHRVNSMSASDSTSPSNSEDM